MTADRRDVMTVLRRVARSGVLAFALAFVLVFNGLAGLHLMARSSVAANADAAFSSICHNGGEVESPTPGDGDVRRDGCHGCPVCGGPQLAATASNSVEFR